jgi:hypothetical protein
VGFKKRVCRRCHAVESRNFFHYFRAQIYLNYIETICV